MKILSKEIVELEGKIRLWNRAYYDMSEPLVSDLEWDAAYERLQKIAPGSPAILERSQFDADYKHEFPMGSLDKCKTIDDVVKRLSGKGNGKLKNKGLITAKLDGASLTVHYENGRFARAVTRGRTETGKGKIVSANAMMISSIPKSIPCNDKIEVRGECVILLSDFATLSGLSNPRNGASGGISCQDPNQTKERKITFVACKLMRHTSNKRVIDTQPLQELESWGFMTPKHIEVDLSDVKTLKAVIEEWGLTKDSLPYQSDGIVIRLMDDDEYNDMGMTGVCPKGAVAYKFETEKASSVVVSIERNTTRTGRIVPVLNIHPTEICGSVVARITLNNEQWLRDKDVAAGDSIEFEKANEIIPKLVRVLERPEDRVISPTPTQCPSCGGEVSEKGKGGDIECLNDECPAKFIKHIRRILEVLEIKGIDETTIEKMDVAGLLPEVWNIFDITQESLMKAGFGKRESEIMVSSVKNVEAKASRIVSAVGVRMWGRRMVDLAQEANPSVFTDEKLLAGDFKYEELLGTKGIGEAKAKELADAFAPNGYGVKCLSELLKRVKPIKAEAKVVGGKLAGLSFCLSGSMPRGKAAIEADIISNGGSISSGVSKKLSVLVAGEGSGSKSEKATSLGVKIISEDELYQMISG